MFRKIFIMSFLLFFIFGIANLKAEPLDKIIAIVNGEVVTKSELDELLEFLSMQIRTKNQAEKEKAVARLKEEILERLIEDKLIISEAKKMNLTVEDAEIKSRLNEIKQNFDSEKDFDQYLASRGFIIGDLKRKLKDQILSTKMMDIEVRNKITVEPKEINDYYEFHSQELLNPEERNVSSIFISKENLNEVEFKRKTDSVLRRLKAGEDFSKIQKEVSNMDNLGWIKKGSLIKEVDDAIFGLKLNEVSKPLFLETGCYIFKVEELKPGSPKTLVEAQEEIYSILFNQKAEALFHKWIDGLKKKAYIQIKD